MKLAQLLDNGITVISDIPDDFPLSERQQRARECVIEGKPWINSAIQEELMDLVYPLYFMDFETINPALPRFKGMRPYDQIPFQWSVHIQKKPGGKLEHHEFLAEDESDPRPEFLESLIDKGTDRPTNFSLAPFGGEGGPSGPGEGFQISTPLSGGDRKLLEHSGVGVVINSPP